MHRESLRGLRSLLRRSHPGGRLFVARKDFAQHGALPERLRLRSEQSFEHLSCFVPGWLALGAPYGGEAMNASEAWGTARELLDTCLALYAASDTGLGPERVSFHTLASREAARSEARQRAALDERAARKRSARSGHGGGGLGGGEDGWRAAAALDLLSEDEDYEVLDAQCAAPSPPPPPPPMSSWLLWPPSGALHAPRPSPAPWRNAPHAVTHQSRT